MIPLLTTGLALAGGMAGLAFVVLWLRNRLLGMRSGGLDPRCLQVVARVGLHANQGLALVRVGRRILLVSSGEGGARMLTELSEEDLEWEPAAVNHGAFGHELALAEATPLSVSAMKRTGAVMALVVGLGLLTGVQPAAAAGYQVPPPVGVVPGPEAVAAPQVPTSPPTGGATRQDPYGSGAPEVGSIFDALPRMSVRMGEEGEGLQLNGTVGTVLVLGLLSLLPTLLLMTTAFTRILIVLHLLRQALGTQATPPSHLLAGMALLLTGAVMAPTLQEVRVVAVDPWMAGEIEEGVAMSRAVTPMRHWMLAHTRENDLRTFLRISQTPQPMTADDIPMPVLMSAYVTSELRTAFEIGFAIFLPFIVIDLVVAAVLTSMGMFMLPPTMIALPCKLMLFVLMDGWALLMGTLAESFL
ncbi:MAG: flagellar type III secretion system pore protein FliP [Gemmatimonadetes bacterium]|nr:flagellar type III secretion system pore protein FliP [Gemmatimonadota bacterium]NNF12943.1 flagellar type III secretion system pore protein FliP [Gemmatimonadota bacterium]